MAWVCWQDFSVETNLIDPNSKRSILQQKTRRHTSKISLLTTYGDTFVLSNNLVSLLSVDGFPTHFTLPTALSSKNGRNSTILDQFQRDRSWFRYAASAWARVGVWYCCWTDSKRLITSLRNWGHCNPVDGELVVFWDRCGCRTFYQPSVGPFNSWDWFVVFDV